MALYGLSLIWFETSSSYFQLLPFDQDYRVKLLIFVGFDGLISYIYESYLIAWLSKWWNSRKQNMKEIERQNHLKKLIR
jgi:hypothetical protein